MPEEVKKTRTRRKKATQAESAAVNPTADSKINWREKLDSNIDYLLLNKDTAKRKKLITKDYIPRDEEIEILKSLEDDSAKLIFLQFFKDLLHEEGFQSVEYFPIGEASPDYCGLVCKITWKNGQISSGVADAHRGNCYSFTSSYVGAMAENRSFVRSVKSYFNISILGYDEIGTGSGSNNGSGASNTGSGRSTGGNTPQTAPTGPESTLQKIVKEKLNINSFAKFKSHLSEQIQSSKETAWVQPEDYKLWKDLESWDGIPKSKCVELIGKIQSDG